MAGDNLTRRKRSPQDILNFSFDEDYLKSIIIPYTENEDGTSISPQKKIATSAKQDTLITNTNPLGTPTTTLTTLTNADTAYKLPSSEKSGRRTIIVSNNSAYDAYLGQTGVISATTPVGILLPAGGSLTLDCSTGLYGICHTAGISLTITEF